MRITKTEIKNHIEGKDFVEIAGIKETPKKSKVFVNDDGRSGFRWGRWVVWLDECVRTDW